MGIKNKIETNNLVWPRESHVWYQHTIDKFIYFVSCNTNIRIQRQLRTSQNVQVLSVFMCLMEQQKYHQVTENYRPSGEAREVSTSSASSLRTITTRCSVLIGRSLTSWPPNSWPWSTGSSRGSSTSWSITTPTRHDWTICLWFTSPRDSIHLESFNNKEDLMFKWTEQLNIMGVVTK